jgi:hypothetical protein
LASSPEGDIVSSSSTMQPADDFQLDAFTLAKQALSASRQAAAAAKELKLIKVVDNDDDDSLPLRLVSSSFVANFGILDLAFYLFIGYYVENNA